jgi:RHS repeat-associated protein
MAYTSTILETQKPHREASSCAQKTASGKIFASDKKHTYQIERNPLKPQQEKRQTPTKTASGVFYYKYRHYDPSLGRWPSRDPIEEYGGPNLYVFVNNQPTRYWDRLGNSPHGPATPVNDPGATTPGYLPPSPPSPLEIKFNNWYESEKDNMGWIKSLPDCPCDISCKKKELKCVIESIDSSFPGIPNYEVKWIDVEVDSICAPAGWELSDMDGFKNKSVKVFIANFHPGAKYEIRKSGSGGKGGQQCMYDSKGKLITHGAGAGTADRYNPNNPNEGVGNHVDADVDPAQWAMLLDGNPNVPDPNGIYFKKYLEVRPINAGNAASPCPKNP